MLVIPEYEPIFYTETEDNIMLWHSDGALLYKKYGNFIVELGISTGILQQYLRQILHEINGEFYSLSV